MLPLARCTTLNLAASILTLLISVNGISEVKNLAGYADYRYVALSWDYDINDPQLYGFQVHYCELQTWGPHRCKVKSLDKDTIAGTSTRAKQMRHSYIVPGLRMSTNYTFEVRPVANKRMDREYHNPRTSQKVVVSTKGFSAKATLCLPQESEIEVATGPYFGGRIGVEAVDGARCTIDGDPNSPRDVYTLRINHSTCGSAVNETTVSTFVMVQENLPILTHSTRRFLVLCTVQPDTLTVRARLNLPHRYVPPQGSNSVDDEEARGYIDPADLDLQEIRRRDGRMLKLQQHSAPPVMMSNSGRTIRGEPVAHVLLMMVIVVAGATGFATIVWYTTRRNYRNGSEDDTTSTVSYDASIASEPSEINFEIESVCGINDDRRSRSQSFSAHHI